MRGSRFIKVIVAASLVTGMLPNAAFALGADAGQELVAKESGQEIDGALPEDEVVAAGPGGEGGVAADGPEETDPEDRVDPDRKPKPPAGQGADGGVEVDGLEPSVEAPSPSASQEPQAKDDGQEGAKGSEGQGSVLYAAHVANIGWQDEVSDGAMAGTTGRSLDMECLKVELDGLEGSVGYQAHVANVGWQNPVTDGAEAGTTGRGLAIEALRIQLSGAAAESYDVYYRVHSAYLGWLGWACNGDPAGSAGFGYGVQAVQVKLVARGAAVEGYGAAAFKERLVAYEAHVSNLGWLGASYDGATAGTTGRSLPLEALSVRNASTLHAGSIVGQGYVQQAGWQAEVGNGTVGTTGQSRSLQAVRFRLDGELGEAYDVYYRAHVAGVGWLGWAKNGGKAGSVGYDLALEAVQVALVKKGGQAPGTTSDSYRSRGLNYQAHSAYVGWMPPATDQATAGTTGRALALEALCVSLGDQQYAGSIAYQAHVSHVGWQDVVRDGAMTGTTGRGLAIEAVRIKLEGEIADAFDVYYRVHVSNIGWLDWAANDAVAGSTGCSLKAEAVQIALVAKGDAAPGPTVSPSRTLSYSYKANVVGSGWQGAISGGSTAGTTGQGKAIHQLSMTASGSTFDGELQCAVHSANVGWQDYVGDGATAGREGVQIEAIRVRLTGELSQQFDVYYRAHVSNIGWMGWASNGGNAGTARLGYQLEAVQLVVVPKGSAAPGSTSVPYRDADYAANVGRLLQNPELPTGCESVALTIVLQSMGFRLSKTEIADFYMPRSSWDYVNAYVGDPRSWGGSLNMAMPPAVVTAANKFLHAKGASERARNLSGTSFDSLCSYIDRGYPVLVWTTAYMEPPLFNGSSLYGYRSYNNEHCVVMYDYDWANNRVLVSDPLSGVVWRSASAFKSIYRTCGSMAAVID